MVCPALAGGTLKGDVVSGTVSKIQRKALRAEQSLRLFLEFQHLAHRLAVEDTGEVQINEDIKQIPAGPAFRLLAQRLHRLIEHGAVFLLPFSDEPFFRGLAEIYGVL